MPPKVITAAKVIAAFAAVALCIAFILFVILGGILKFLMDVLRLSPDNIRWLLVMALWGLGYLIVGLICVAYLLWLVRAVARAVTLGIYDARNRQERRRVWDELWQQFWQRKFQSESDGSLKKEPTRPGRYETSDWNRPLNF